MVNLMEFDTIALVVSSWEAARKTPAFEETVGISTLMNLFELEPLTKACFGFDEKFDFKKQCSGLCMMGVLIHAQRMMAMLNSALGLLGPDQELLTEIISDAGARHVKFVVKARYIPYFFQALVPALSEALGSQWTIEVAQAWEIVMDELGSDLMKAITEAEQPGKTAPSCSATTMSFDESLSSMSVFTETTASCSFSCDEIEVKEKSVIYKIPRKSNQAKQLERRNSMPRTLSSSYLGSGEVVTRSPTTTNIADTQVYHSPRTPTKKSNRLGLRSMSRALQKL